MRLAFMGTPDFAVPALAALIEAGHEVAAVYSQPPRPSGRGHKEQPSPVHAFAQTRGIPVFTPPSLKTTEAQQAFGALALDVAVVAAYGLILPKAVLDAPRMGCVNIHGSLLPRWRGAAPVQRAILAGDQETGITIMRMDEGLDTGPMLLKQSVPIGPATTASDLHDRLAEMGARLIVEALARLERGDLPAAPQPVEGVTYARKLEKGEGRIDWSRPAAFILRQVRALNPWPGMWCEVGGERIKVLAAAPGSGTGRPGEVLDELLTVACGEGAVRLVRLQRPGKAPMSAFDLSRGFAIPKGSILPCPATSS